MEAARKLSFLSAALVEPRTTSLPSLNSAKVHLFASFDRALPPAW